jgi:hypothetical protein
MFCKRAEHFQSIVLYAEFEAINLCQPSPLEAERDVPRGSQFTSWWSTPFIFAQPMSINTPRG